MNETLERADVASFVEQVRKHLADLSEEDRQELTEGLTADLGDLVSEQGPEVLADPASYAAELRQAAGLEVPRRSRHLPRPSAAAVDGLLDAAHARWDALLAAVPFHPAGLLESLRPAWWVLRAWLAVEVADQVFGSWPYSWIPSIAGPLGWVALLAAIVASVEVGRGRIWPAPLVSTWRRVVLLALNTFAVIALAPTIGQLPTPSDVTDAYDSPAYAPDALVSHGQEVQNIYPYDAQGHPLVGVQLVDQDGRRVGVSHYGRQLVPWTNGRTRLYSVFPLPERAMDEDTGAYQGSGAIDPPLASLPPVSNLGVVASVLAGQVS